jgi:replicative DNA helicase
MTADASDYMMDDAPPSEPPSEPAPNLKLDSGLPANESAEVTILGAIMLDNAAFNEAAEHLETGDFSLDSHQRIFLRMSDLMDANQAVDIVTLANELARNKEIETVGGVAYLASLTEGLPLRPVIEDYIRIVKDKSQLRRIMSICSSAIARAADQSEPAIEVLEAAEGQLLEIAQEAHTQNLRAVYESVQIAGGPDEYIAPIINPDRKIGLPTGFIDYDDMTGGLQKGELTIIAARPGMGKSGLLGNICENICSVPEHVVALFSLEMSRTSMEHRLLASIARVDLRKLLTGFLTSQDKEKLQLALSTLVEMDLYIDDSPSLTPTQMRAKVRRLKQRKGRLDMIGLDYVQLLSGGHKFSNRQEEVSFVSRSLKQMSKEMDCPVVALAQLNRGNESRQDKRPVLSDLRESGQIEQDADVCAFIHREDYYNRDEEERTNIAEILLGKQRNGPTGVVRTVFISSYVKFCNLARG